MSDIWFQTFKKIKGDSSFAEQREALEQLLSEGGDVNACDKQGRTALAVVLSKPTPSANAIEWLLNQGADPQLCRYDDIRLELTELYPAATDSSAQLLEKQYRAAPYLLLMQAHERQYGCEEGVAGAEYWQGKFHQALSQRRSIDALKGLLPQLGSGFAISGQPLLQPWQSHWGGEPYLPQLSLPAELEAHPSKVLLLQLNFDELNHSALSHPLPTSGLLQVYVTPPSDEDDEPHLGSPLALFWPQLPTDQTGWLLMPSRKLCSGWLRTEVSGQALKWQGYRQLPQVVDAQALQRLPESLTPTTEAMEAERESYNFGLLPQLGGYHRPFLPEGRVSLLHLMHRDHGSSLLSLPLDALDGDGTDWSQLQYHYCDD